MSGYSLIPARRGSLSAFIALMVCCAVMPCSAGDQAANLLHLTQILPPGLGPDWVRSGFSADVGKGGNLVLAPRDTEQRIASDSNLRVEFLVLLPYAAGSSGAAGFSGGDPRSTLRAFARACADVRSLEGLEYWSASRGRKRLLYSEAFLLSPTPAGDPPWEMEVRLRDLTFGSNRYSLCIRESGMGLEVLLTNLDLVRWGFLPLAQPGGMRTRVLALACAEGLLIHYTAMVDAPGVLASRVFDSMGNKSLAVMKWFAARASEAGIAGPGALPVKMEEID